MSSFDARIESEIGRLRRVVIHTPGREIESMSPRTASQVLYHDIIPLSVVSGEHAVLKRFLSLVARVDEVTGLLAEALADPGQRELLVNAVCGEDPAARRIAELLEERPERLVTMLVNGLAARRETLSDLLYGPEHDLPPLANLYFMRDSSFVVRDRVVVGAMAHRVRSGEAMLLRSIFGSSIVVNAGILYDGCEEAGRRADVRIEGGDVLVVRRDLLVVGVSERTSAAAIDELSRRLVESTGEPLSVIVVLLPHDRSTIHLDMVFTLLDPETALVYEPHVTGPRRLEVYRMRLAPGATTRFEKCDGLIAALAAEGEHLRTIACGGRDPVVREREQWLSAANVFAFAPGKIVGYDCNVATMQAFSEAGYAVHPAEDFVEGRRSADSYERLFVGIPGVNLARGGGGPRCMTLPVVRDPV